MTKKTFSLYTKAWIQIQPLFELKKVRIGASVYQVPKWLPPSQQENQGFTWLLLAARSKAKRESVSQHMTSLLLEASEGKGDLVKKKKTLHTLAERNKGFLHYRWW